MVRLKILCYGSLNIDYVYDVEHFVEPGETLNSLKMEKIHGGKGLNQAIAIARAGHPVALAGAVSASGAFLTEYCAQNGVSISDIVDSDAETGHAIIQVAPDGQNCILLYGGANRGISRPDIDRTLARFERGDYLVLQNEINHVDYLMNRGHALGMKIVFNPSPIDAAIDTYPLDKVDIMILNEIEAEKLTTAADPKEMLTQLGERYPNATVVLTLGAQGAYLRNGEDVLFQSAFSVNAVDTTGAGDTFTGYFVAGHAVGKPFDVILETASKAAAIAVSRKGASDSIPTMDEVAQY